MSPFWRPLRCGQAGRHAVVASTFCPGYVPAHRILAALAAVGLACVGPHHDELKTLPQQYSMTIVMGPGSSHDGQTCYFRRSCIGRRTVPDKLSMNH